MPTACRPSARNTGLKAIEIGSPFNKISIASVACASSPAPASSETVLLANSKRSGTVLSVTNATRRTESRKGATSTIAVVVTSCGNKWWYGGNVPSNIREVIDLPSPANPARRSLLVFGAKESETFLEPVKDFAASAMVRPRSRAVVESPGVVGCQVNSRTAKRYLSVAASVTVSSFISTCTPVRVGSESSLPAAMATCATAVANKSLATTPVVSGSSGKPGYSEIESVGRVNFADPEVTKTLVPSSAIVIGLFGREREISANSFPGTKTFPG